MMRTVGRLDSGRTAAAEAPPTEPPGSNEGSSMAMTCLLLI